MLWRIPAGPNHQGYAMQPTGTPDTTVPEFDKRLHREISAFRYDPLGYVLFAFPWRIEGTELAHEPGPEPWQSRLLVNLGQGLIQRRERAGLVISEAIRLAVASGHGIGKSALVSWIILWALSTVR